MKTMHQRRNKLYYQFVGKLIRLERRNRVLSCQALAERSMLPVEAIVDLEVGEYVPTHKTMEIIAKALQIPITRIFPTILDWGK